MHTARSRTSNENLFDTFIAPSSQELEPPQDTGRFNFLPTADEDIWIAVASRTIMGSLVEQMRVRLVPLFHGLHGHAYVDSGKAKLS